VLDLGCAPGSWLLYAAELTSGGGKVVGIDQKPVAIQTPDHVKVYTGDALDEVETVVGMIGRGFNVVISEAVKRRFRQQKTFKPQSSRKASKEIFIIGLDKI